MGNLDSSMVKRNFKKDPVTEDDLNESIWYVVVDDLVGGWAITTADTPTSQINPWNGEFEVGVFMLKEAAEHIVKLHNDWLEIKIWATYMPNIEWSFKNSLTS